jgi:hypothetical protein
MYATKARFLHIYDASSHFRYLFHDGRDIAVATVGAATADEAMAAIRSFEPARRNAQPAVSLVLAFAPDAQYSSRDVLQIGQHFVREALPGSASIIAYHGAPFEPVNSHAHILAARPQRPDGSHLAIGDVSRSVRRAAKATRDQFGIAAPNTLTRPSYRPATRGDTYTLHEWIHALNLADHLRRAASPDAFFSLLHEHSLDYVPSREGYAIIDRSLAGGPAVRSSAIDASFAALQDRFGSFTIPPYAPERARVSYAVERDMKFSQRIVEAHEHARETWHQSTEPLLHDRQQAIRQGARDSKANLRTLVRTVERNLPEPLNSGERAASLRFLREQLRMDKDLQLRNVEESLPARPPYRIGDWLRTLVAPSQPPAGATLRNVTWDWDRAKAWDVEASLDLYLWRDGVRVARWHGDDLSLCGTAWDPEDLAQLPITSVARIDLQAPLHPDALEGIEIHAPIATLPEPSPDPQLERLRAELPPSIVALLERRATEPVSTAKTPPPLALRRRRSRAPRR